MTEAPELSIGGGGSVTMMSNRSVGQLEVVPAVGDDDPSVRVGQHRSPRPGSRSRTCRARTGRARRRRSRSPAMSAERNAVPIPNATTSARSDVGPGDERQDRHELGVDGQQGHRRARRPTARVSRGSGPPGPTRSRPRSRRRSAPPASSDEGLVRLDDGAGPDDEDDRRSPATPTPTTTVGETARPPRSAPAPMPRRRVRSIARTTTTAGEPIVGIRTNGTSRLPRIGPGRVRREQRAGLRPGLRAPRRAAAPRRSGTRCRARW